MVARWFWSTDPIPGNYSAKTYCNDTKLPFSGPSLTARSLTWMLAWQWLQGSSRRGQLAKCSSRARRRCSESQPLGQFTRASGHWDMCSWMAKKGQSWFCKYCKVRKACQPYWMGYGQHHKLKLDIMMHMFSQVKYHCVATNESGDNYPYLSGRFRRWKLC